MTATKTRPISELMRETLEKALVDSRWYGLGVLGPNAAKSGTMAALVGRGLITPMTTGQCHYLTEAGAEALGFDWATLVERTHTRALEMDAERVGCPLCERAFLPHGKDWNRSEGDAITAEEKMLVHVAYAHVPVDRIGYIGGRLTARLNATQEGIVRSYLAEQLTAVRSQVDLYRRTPGDDDSTDRVWRRVQIEREFGEFLFLRTLAATRPEALVTALLAEAEAARVQDVEEARTLARREHMERHPGDVVMDSLHLARLEGWADVAVEETPSVFPGAPPVRTHADGGQAYGPYDGLSEREARACLAGDTAVTVEGSEGRIDDVAVLGGVKFHVTGVNLDGWYYSRQIRLAKAPTTPARPAVDFEVRPQSCDRDDTHTMHVWSHLGPDPVWLCYGDHAMDVQRAQLTGTYEGS